jgi:hypothetical protein
MHGESVTSNPLVAISERTQMIKAAIVGLGWRGSTIHREFCLQRAMPHRYRSLSDPAIPTQGDCEMSSIDISRASAMG